MASRRITLGLGMMIGIAPWMLGSNEKSKLYGWGFNKNGELGLGTEQNCSLPQEVKSLESFRYIHAKKYHSAAISTEGILYTWGKNRQGILGHSPPNLSILQPRPVEIDNNTDKIVKVSCGGERLSALTQTGQVYLWGIQESANKLRRDPPPKQDRSTSILPMKLNISNIVEISCAEDYTLMVNSEGQLFCQNGRNQDIESVGLTKISKIDSGINFSLALTLEGKVYAWGNNSFGQLGIGSLRSALKPVLLESLDKEKIIDISCGDNYSAVVTEKGDVYTWGFGNEGQLGHGDKSDQFTPRKIASLGNNRIKKVSCGAAHTAFITESGQILMVGRGREGQLGREKNDEGSSGYSLLPKIVDQLPKNYKVESVACGGNHTIVLIL